MHNEVALQAGGLQAMLLQVVRDFTLHKGCWEREGLVTGKGMIEVLRVNGCEF